MIKEVKEIQDVEEVNELLKEGWKLLNTVSNSKLIYIMVFYEKRSIDEKQGTECTISKGEYEMKDLEIVCAPVVNYIKKNWDPHCTIIITDSQIKLVRDEIGIKWGTAQEVQVQEQYVGKCNHCGANNEIKLPNKLEPRFCMNCGKAISYQKNL